MEVITNTDQIILLILACYFISSFNFNQILASSILLHSDTGINSLIGAI
jgi:hypothetical protein